MKDKIILDNIGLIYKAIKDMHCTFVNENDFEDYYYAGLIGLLKASKKYDESKGKSGYLYRAIKMELRNLFTYRRREKRYSELKDISLNSIINGVELQDLIADEFNLEDDIMQKEFIEWILNKLKNKRYKTFLIEYYGINCKALNGAEIAKKYGVSTSFVNKSIKLAIEKLRKEFKK